MFRTTPSPPDSPLKETPSMTPPLPPLSPGTPTEAAMSLPSHHPVVEKRNHSSLSSPELGRARSPSPTSRPSPNRSENEPLIERAKEGLTITAPGALKDLAIKIEVNEPSGVQDMEEADGKATYGKDENVGYGESFDESHIPKEVTHEGHAAEYDDADDVMNIPASYAVLCQPHHNVSGVISGEPELVKVDHLKMRREELEAEVIADRIKHEHDLDGFDEPSANVHGDLSLAKSDQDIAELEGQHFALPLASGVVVVDSQKLEKLISNIEPSLPEESNILVQPTGWGNFADVIHNDDLALVAKAKLDLERNGGETFRPEICEIYINQQGKSQKTLHSKIGGNATSPFPALSKVPDASKVGVVPTSDIEDGNTSSNSYETQDGNTPRPLVAPSQSKPQRRRLWSENDDKLTDVSGDSPDNRRGLPKRVSFTNPPVDIDTPFTNTLKYFKTFGSQSKPKGKENSSSKNRRNASLPDELAEIAKQANGDDDMEDLEKYREMDLGPLDPVMEGNNAGDLIVATRASPMATSKKQIDDKLEKEDDNSNNDVMASVLASAVAAKKYHDEKFNSPDRYSNVNETSKTADHDAGDSKPDSDDSDATVSPIQPPSRPPIVYMMRVPRPDGEMVELTVESTLLPSAITGTMSELGTAEGVREKDLKESVKAFLEDPESFVLHEEAGQDAYVPVRNEEEGKEQILDIDEGDENEGGKGENVKDHTTQDADSGEEEHQESEVEADNEPNTPGDKNLKNTTAHDGIKIYEPPIPGSSGEVTKLRVETKASPQQIGDYIRAYGAEMETSEGDIGNAIESFLEEPKGFIVSGDKGGSDDQVEVAESDNGEHIFIRIITLVPMTIFWTMIRGAVSYSNKAYAAAWEKLEELAGHLH